MKSTKTQLPTELVSAQFLIAAVVGTLVWASACSQPGKSKPDAAMDDDGVATMEDSGMADGGTNTATPDVDRDFDEALRQHARTRCEYIERCTDDYGWRAIWGDTETCIDTLVLPLHAEYTDGDPATIDDLAGCDEDTRSASCESLPDSCEFESRSNGEPCTQNTQCASDFCFIEETATACGTCHARTTEGDDCLVQDEDGTMRWFCTDRQICDDDEVCRERVSIGESCVDRECVLEAACVDDECVANGGLGDPCSNTDPSFPRCNDLQGFVCDEAAGECVEIQLVDIGEACGRVDGVLTFCEGPATCRGDTERRCVARSAEGEECGPDPIRDVPCQLHLQCVDGQCQRRQCAE